MLLHIQCGIIVMDVHLSMGQQSAWVLRRSSIHGKLALISQIPRIFYSYLALHWNSKRAAAVIVDELSFIKSCRSGIQAILPDICLTLIPECLQSYWWGWLGGSS